MEAEFIWYYPPGAERKTSFKIEKTTLEKELARFGLIAEKKLDPFFLKKRGFIISGKRTSGTQLLGRHAELEISVDYRQIYERNIPLFKELSKTLFNSSGSSVDKDPLFPLLSFVQQIKYAVPPQFYQNKFINSFFVPLVCLYEKYGDCDSKSVLLAVFINSLQRYYLKSRSEEKLALILIRSSRMNHAMLTVRRTPLPGMISLYDQQKGYFIVIEPSCPGWSPGFVSNAVIDELKTGNFYFLELN